MVPLSDVAVFSRLNLGEISPEVIAERGALLLVDKPSGWTSFDVVAKIRGMLRVKKVGHTGTLDPLATGLLILCLGKATKLADTIQAGEKEYTGTIRFGATTTTDDAEGEENEQFSIAHLTDRMIHESATGFVGESLQIPPMFSARKKDGQRLYKLARRGETVEVPPRLITIMEFSITEVNLPDAKFKVVCSKGTYIRSLARDMGEKMETGGYLTELRRTRSGSFSVADAVTMQELQQLREQRGEIAL